MKRWYGDRYVVVHVTQRVFGHTRAVEWISFWEPLEDDRFSSEVSLRLTFIFHLSTTVLAVWTFISTSSVVEERLISTNHLSNSSVVYSTFSRSSWLGKVSHREEDEFLLEFFYIPSHISCELAFNVRNRALYTSLSRRISAHWHVYVVDLWN
jgi:hypothetical protein